jgi:hypothetical protein
MNAWLTMAKQQRAYPVTGVQTQAYQRRDGTWKVVQFQAQHVSIGGS